MQYNKYIICNIKVNIQGEITSGSQISWKICNVHHFFLPMSCQMLIYLYNIIRIKLYYILNILTSFEGKNTTIIC